MHQYSTPTGHCPLRRISSLFSSPHLQMSREPGCECVCSIHSCGRLAAVSQSFELRASLGIFPDLAQPVVWRGFHGLRLGSAPIDWTEYDARSCVCTLPPRVIDSKPGVKSPLVTRHRYWRRNSPDLDWREGAGEMPRMEARYAWSSTSKPSRMSERESCREILPRLPRTKKTLRI